MRSKLYKFVLFFLLIFVIFEIYTFYKAEGNTSIAVLGGSIGNDIGKSVLLINNKAIDTIDLDIHYSYSGVKKLPFGKNEIKIKGIETNIEYNTSITFIGIFTWHTLVILEDKKLMHEKYYYPPRLE